nr:hypothetical protein [Tanacetum cinerariifolium]
MFFVAGSSSASLSMVESRLVGARSRSGLHVDNDMARSMATERVGFDTKSLLEQLRDSYENSDYDEDPYDDNMYEGQDLPDKIQDICDNLDIRVRGRKKK